MAYVLVVNASAGSSDRDDVERALGVLHAAGEHADIVETAEPSELDDVARGVEAGDVLIACGGDGSIHALVAAVLRVDRLEEVALGLLPMGTGNDLARHLDLPLDDVEAVMRRLLAATPRPMDLLAASDGDICVNALHAGVGVDAASRAEDLKEKLGKVAYPLGAIAAGVTADGWLVTVEVDDEILHDREDGPILFLAVCNARGFGGGTVVAPDASVEDGLLDVVVSTSVSPTARAAFGAALARGTHLDRDDVHHVTGRKVVVRGDRIGWNVDGELDEHGTSHRTWTVQQGAWSLLA